MPKDEKRNRIRSQEKALRVVTKFVAELNLVDEYADATPSMRLLLDQASVSAEETCTDGKWCWIVIIHHECPDGTIIDPNFILFAVDRESWEPRIL